MRAETCLRAALLLVAVQAVGAPASAQAPDRIDCSYDECALRIKNRFFGTDLVRGVGDEKVAGLGFVVGSLDDQFAGSRVAQDLAARYRGRHNWGSVLGLLGTIATVASIFTLDWDTQSTGDATGALLVGGAALVLTGALVENSGRDYISRAVWEYNRALAP